MQSSGRQAHVMEYTSFSHACEQGSTGQTIQIVLAPNFNLENFKDLEEFQSALPEGQGGREWRLDMRPLAFMDSLMLGMLVRFHIHLAGRGDKLVMLVRPGSKIEEVIHLCKLNRIITTLAE